MSDVPAAQREHLYEWLKQLKTCVRKGDTPSRADRSPHTEMVSVIDIDE